MKWLMNYYLQSKRISSIGYNVPTLGEVGDYEAQNLNIKKMLNRNTTAFSMVDFTTVHQLQNIYYALTGVII